MYSNTQYNFIIEYCFAINVFRYNIFDIIKKKHKNKWKTVVNYCCIIRIKKRLQFMIEYTIYIYTTWCIGLKQPTQQTQQTQPNFVSTQKQKRFCWFKE